MEYHDSQVHLLRSLQSLKPTTTIEKTVELNLKLKENDWSTVTADILRTAPVMTTFDKSALSLFSELRNVKVVDGKSVAFPTPKKPQTQYYVDLLMLRDWDPHTAILGTALRLLSTAKSIENSNRNKPLGPERTLRFVFSMVRAPREVFTVDDPSVSIRKVMLDTGTKVQVIHEWNRYSAHPVPSNAAN